MIVDMFLSVLAGFLRLVTAPIEVINVAIDLVSSIPVVENFVRVVAYLVPFSNLLPLIILSFTILFLRTTIGVWRGILGIIKN